MRSDYFRVRRALPQEERQRANVSPPSLQDASNTWELGIQKHTQKLHLNSGSGAKACARTARSADPGTSSRNDIADRVMAGLVPAIHALLPKKERRGCPQQVRA
jgi:hypothetical protein